MRPLIKTLFGDARNALVVVLLLLGQTAMLRLGLGREAVFIIPAATMAGVAWLASR